MKKHLKKNRLLLRITDRRGRTDIGVTVSKSRRTLKRLRMFYNDRPTVAFVRGKLGAVPTALGKRWRP